MRHFLTTVSAYIDSDEYDQAKEYIKRKSGILYFIYEWTTASC